MKVAGGGPKIILLTPQIRVPYNTRYIKLINGVRQFVIKYLMYLAHQKGMTINLTLYSLRQTE